MKQRRPIRWLAALLALAAALVLTVGAVQGSQEDPLVTLGYLTEKFLPQVLTKVEEKGLERDKTLETKLQAMVDGYAEQMEKRFEKALSKGGGGVSSGFVVLTLNAGQRLTLSAGGELLFRSGAAKCSASGSPGLVDTTTGDILLGGDLLTVNHLYLATDGGRGLTASDTVTVLVRGSYLIE